MKATELRIGNWLQSRRGIPYQVTSEDIVIIEDGQSKSKPIPLSPALLNQCGFEGDYHGKGSELVFRKKWYGFNIDLWQGAAPPFDHWIIPYSPTSVYFLHQLQNLFFAMTGEELNIDLCPN